MVGAIAPKPVRKLIRTRSNLRSGVLFSEERESIATRESAVSQRSATRCREGGYDRRLAPRRFVSDFVCFGIYY